MNVTHRLTAATCVLFQSQTELVRLGQEEVGAAGLACLSWWSLTPAAPGQVPWWPVMSVPPRSIQGDQPDPIP